MSKTSLDNRLCEKPWGSELTSSSKWVKKMSNPYGGHVKVLYSNNNSAGKKKKSMVDRLNMKSPPSPPNHIEMLDKFPAATDEERTESQSRWGGDEARGPTRVFMGTGCILYMLRGMEMEPKPAPGGESPAASGGPRELPRPWTGSRELCLAARRWV